MMTEGAACDVVNERVQRGGLGASQPPKSRLDGRLGCERDFTMVLKFIENLGDSKCFSLSLTRNTPMLAERIPTTGRQNNRLPWSLTDCQLCKR